MPRIYQPRPKQVRPCLRCGRPAFGRADVKYCSGACREAARRARKAAKA